MKYINCLFIFSVTFFSAALFAQESKGPVTMPLPEDVEEHNLPGSGLLFDFHPQEQGMLVIAAEGVEDEGEHIIITLHDEYGQKIQQIRNDYKGKASAQGIFIVPDAGKYTVAVQLNEVEEIRLFYGQQSADLKAASVFSSMAINIESSFISNIFSSLISTDKDGDENPSKAVRLEPGIEVQTSVGNEANDPWDWWRVEGASGDMTITVRGMQNGRVQVADLVLELYIPNTLQREWLRQDDVTTGEEVLRVGASGEPVIFRVKPYYHEDYDDKREAIHYVIKVEIEGEEAEAVVAAN